MSRIGKLPITVPAGVTVTIGDDHLVTVKGPKGTLSQQVNPAITLKYMNGKQTPVIAGLKRISNPGLRVYARSEELPKVLGGLGIAIISTSKGLMTDKEARKAAIGGEVLAYIW